MSVPSWYELLLLGLAVWRTYALASRDDIANRPRDWLISHSARISTFLDCPYCAGFWIALAWWGLWQAWPQALTIAASAIALTAIVPLLEHMLSAD